jgi:hypothetical protein
MGRRNGRCPGAVDPIEANACSRPGRELQFPPMPALAQRHAPLAPRPARPRLRAVPPPRRRRAPSARALALYALGLTAGFLLAALASLPSGESVVTGQVALAGIAAAVGALAALRWRAVARRSGFGRGARAQSS